MIEVRIHNHIFLEVADVANRNVFNNRICELKKYAIHTVRVFMHIICQSVVSVTVVSSRSIVSRTFSDEEADCSGAKAFVVVLEY